MLELFSLIRCSILLFINDIEFEELVLCGRSGVPDCYSNDLSSTL